MLVEELEGGAFFGVDLADACGEDHFDIGEVPKDNADGPEAGVGVGGPGLVELVVGEFEDSGVDAFDADAHAGDEFFG